jgi:hypothetical protein
VSNNKGRDFIRLLLDKYKTRVVISCLDIDKELKLDLLNLSSKLYLYIS